MQTARGSCIYAPSGVSFNMSKLFEPHLRSAAQRRESRGTPLVRFFATFLTYIKKVDKKLSPTNIKKGEKLPPFYLKKFSESF